MVALALERAPAVCLPLRYLRMVPVWGLVAAVLVWQQGAGLFASRWAPATVALTHVFTLGVLGNAMLGSLLQFLPVVAHARARRLERIASALPILFNAGLLGLVCGLLFWPLVIPVAGFVLACAIALFSTSALAGLHFDGRQSALRSGIAIALVSLLAAAILGLLLTFGLQGALALPMLPLTDCHAAIALLGATLLLCGSVGSVVLPMFQGTAKVPGSALAGWIGALTAALFVAVFLRLRETVDAGGMVVIMALPVATFAVAVFALQWRALHRHNHALVGFWRLGALALLAATVVALGGAHFPDARIVLFSGVLGIGIALPALVLGMLLEITAFLTWLDLRRGLPRGIRVPGIDALFCESRKQRLLLLHASTALVLPAAVVWPTSAMIRLAALALGLSYGLTLFEMLALRRRSGRFAQRLQIRPGDTA